MKKLIIIGAGGNSMDVLDTIDDINRASAKTRYDCIGFLDDDPQKAGMFYRGKTILGKVATAGQYPDASFVFTIGSPFNFWIRNQLIDRMNIARERFETVVHPTAYISPSAKLGCGTVILPNTTVASGVTLGDHLMILPHAVISHDVSIDDYTVIASSATISGNVTIGAGCYLGANCSMIGGITVGRQCLIGIGAVVIRSLEENGVYVGNPAKFLRPTA